MRFSHEHFELVVSLELEFLKRAHSKTVNYLLPTTPLLVDFTQSLSLQECLSEGDIIGLEPSILLSDLVEGEGLVHLVSALPVSHNFVDKSETHLQFFIHIKLRFKRDEALLRLKGTSSTPRAFLNRAVDCVRD